METDSKEVANLKDAMRRVDLDWSEKYSKLEEDSLKDRRELLQKAEQAERISRTSFHSFVKSLTELRRSMRKSLRGRWMPPPCRTIKPYSRPIFPPLLTA